MVNKNLTQKIGALFTGGLMLGTALLTPVQADARTRIHLDLRRGRLEVFNNDRYNHSRIRLDGRNNQADVSYNDRNANIRVRSDLNGNRKRTSPGHIASLLRRLVHDNDHLYGTHSQIITRVNREGNDSILDYRIRIDNLKDSKPKLIEDKIKFPWSNNCYSSDIKEAQEKINEAYK